LVLFLIPIEMHGMIVRILYVHIKLFAPKAVRYESLATAEKFSDSHARAANAI